MSQSQLDLSSQPLNRIKSDSQAWIVVDFARAKEHSWTAIRYIGVLFLALAVGTSTLTFNWVVDYDSRTNFFPEFGGKVIYLSDIFLFFGLAFWVLGWQMGSPHKLRLGPRYVYLPLLLLAGLTTLSTIWANDGALAGHVALRRVLLVGLYVAFVNEGKRASIYMTVILLGMGLLHAIVSIAQVLNGSTIGFSALGEITEGQLGFAAVGFPRAYGLGFNPNPVGLILATAGVLAYALVLRHWTRGWGTRLALALVMAVMLAGIVSTGSRSSLVGAFMAIVAITSLMLIQRSTSPRATLIRMGILFGLVAVAALTTLLFSVRTDPVQSGLQGRIADYQHSLSIIRSDFLIGVGAGNYPDELNRRSNHGGADRPAYLPIHNVPLLLLAELGIAGTLGWLLIMAAPIVWLLIWLKGKRPATDSLLWLAPLIVLLFESLVDFTPWATQDGRVLMFGVLAIWAGVVASESNSQESIDDQRQRE